MKSLGPKSMAFTIFAILSILVGTLVPSQTLLDLLRSDAEGIANEFLIGATLFRLSLVLLGLLIVVLSRLPIWETEESDQQPAGSESTLEVRLLALVLIVSFLMRLYQLSEGLWFDEILTYMNYARLPLGQVISTYASENQHILFSILARIGFVLFGESAWALRLPAVLFGVGSIWALFLLGRLVSGSREALLASALMAFSYHHVWFSQNARGYTGLLFWAILASWLFLLALQQRRPDRWLWYGLSAALGMYTHLTMMFVIFGHLVIFLLTWLQQWKENRERKWLGLFLGFGSAGFLTFLFYSLVIPQLLMTIDETESVVNEWKNPLWTLLELVNGIVVNFSSGAVVLGGIAVTAALIVFGIGVVSYWRTSRNIVLLLFVPSIVGASLTVAMGHHLWPRFFFFAFGFGALVAVRGIMLLGDWFSKLFKASPARSRWLGTALNVGATFILAMSVTFAYGPKQDYEGAMAYVESQKMPGDAIVAVDLAAHIYDEFYNLDWQTVETETELDSVRSEASRTWLLYTFPPVLASVSPDIMEQIERDFVVMEVFGGSVREGMILVAMADGSS